MNELVMQLDSISNYLFWLHCPRDGEDDQTTPIVSTAVRDFKTYLSECGQGHLFSEVINSSVYEWYHGNFATMILSMVFLPHIMMNQGEPYTVSLSPHQIHDALVVLYELVVCDNLNLKAVDYYGETPLMMVDHILEMYGPSIPQHILESVESFRYVLVYGQRMKQKHLQLLQRWRSRVLERKKKAVCQIENWWLEIKLSPYTRVGRRTIRTLSSHFIELHHSTQSP